MVDTTKMPESPNVEERPPSIEELIKGLNLDIPIGPTSDPWTPRYDLTQPPGIVPPGSIPVPRPRFYPEQEWLDVLSAMSSHPFALMEPPGSEPGKGKK